MRPDLNIRSGCTRDEALRSVRHAFAEAGLDSPAIDARVLVTAALGLRDVDLLAGGRERLSVEDARRLGGYVARRLGREPVQRILGRAEFWGLPFDLSPETLVPRPDTEMVVSEALALASRRGGPAAILDLGTGTGCILVALLHELGRATGVGLDRSPGALRTARANAALNGVGERASFVASDWATAVESRFDLIVSNPPYIRTDVIPELAPEVGRSDPPAALDGGPDGLDAYRTVLADIARLLLPSGLAVVEIGYDQADGVSELARERGLRVVRPGRDLAGHVRTVALARSV